MDLVEITGIANGGAGVGRLPDGRVTFVQRTAPGDRVEVRVVEDRGSWTRSELVRVVEPGPDRQDAPCPHYDECGGCVLQHLSYEAQLRAKATVVTDALQRIGDMDVAVTEVTPSPEPFRYRNRITLTLRRGSDGVVAGFHAVDEPDRLVDVSSACLLPEAPIASAWGALREAWGPDARRLPSGAELRLTLRADRAGAVALAVDGGYAPGRPEELLEAVDGLVAVWHRPDGAGSYRTLAGAPALGDRWAGLDVTVRGDVFTQVNRGAAGGLTDHVIARALASSPGRVVDAYSGLGLYTRRLEAEGVEVTAIEADPMAVAEAREGVRGQILEGKVEDRLNEALPADVAILNPPRAGLATPVTDRLAEDGPARVLYVSCDPATLARDLKRLAGRYEVAGLRSFDLFPQTAHVETVVELERCATT